jgi:hypothetical protein
MTLARRIAVLGVLSVAGIALLAPLAARSASPATTPLTSSLLSVESFAGRPLVADRGGLAVRLPAASNPVPEALHPPPALPTPAAAPMEATLLPVATAMPTPVPTPAPTPVPVIAAAPAPPAPAAPPPTYSGSSVWDDLAKCESGGNWSINTGNGYYGGLQFSYDTWHGYDGGEFAEYPHQASREEQIIVAERLRAVRGYAPWPACRAKLGLP